MHSHLRQYDLLQTFLIYTKVFQFWAFWCVKQAYSCPTCHVSWNDQPSPLTPASDLAWVNSVIVDLPAVKRRADTMGTKRTVKKEWQAAWLLRAISCIDLTTLSGQFYSRYTVTRPFLAYCAILAVLRRRRLLRNAHLRSDRALPVQKIFEVQMTDQDSVWWNRIDCLIFYEISWDLNKAVPVMNEGIVNIASW